jgi:exopolyphosphatase/guanosine-5'-triphosphate,3'-diphosphate pyrophosphatase
MDEYPDAAVSLPLGAGRLTGGWLPGDPPSAQDVRNLRRHVRAEIARTVAEFARLGPADHVVGTSKTFRQLARIAGAARSADGLYVQRVLRSGGPGCRGCRRAGRGNCSRARWWPRGRWTSTG